MIDRIPRTGTYACIFCLLFSLVSTQTVQQLLWNTPNGNAEDLSLTFTNSQTIPLSWNSANTSQYFDSPLTDVYLWCTSFDWNLNQYASLLKSNIDLTVPGNFAWTIDIPDNYLSVSAKYVLRFKSPNATYNSSSQQLSSPGFLVLATSTTTTSSSLTSYSKPTMMSSFPATPSPTPSSSAAPAPSGITSGARAGIGIGVSIGALALAGLVSLLLWRRRKRSSSAAESPSNIAEREDSQYRTLSQRMDSSPFELDVQGSKPILPELGDGGEHSN